MNKLFDVDNKFFSTLSKVWDLIVLDLLWLLTVLIFIGPACTGLYYAVVKNIRKSRGYTGGTFFHSFKTNFKQAAVIGIFQIIIGFGLFVCYTFAINMNPDMYFGQIYYWVTVFLILVFAMVSIYVYPVLSRFTMKTGAILKLCLFMSVRHIGTTLLGVVGIALVVFSWTMIVYSPLLLVAPAVYVFLLSFPMEKVLRRYMPKKEEQSEQEQEAWYYE